MGWFSFAVRRGTQCIPTPHPGVRMGALHFISAERRKFRIRFPILPFKSEQAFGFVLESAAHLPLKGKALKVRSTSRAHQGVPRGEAFHRYNTSRQPGTGGRLFHPFCTRGIR